MTTAEINEKKLEELIHKAVMEGMLLGASSAVITVVLYVTFKKLMGVE